MNELGKCVHGGCHYSAKVVELGSPLCFVHSDARARERWRVRFARYATYIQAQEVQRERDARMVAAYPGLIQALELARTYLEGGSVGRDRCLAQIKACLTNQIAEFLEEA